MTTQTTQTQLPQLENKALVEGYVHSHDLQIKQYNRTVDGKPVPSQKVQGNINIQVSENETHKVAVDINELTSAGNINKLYAGINTLMNEMVTISDLSDATKEFPEGTEPTKLRVQGELAKNEYFNEGGLQSFFQIKPRFVPNRIKAGDKFEPKAEFDVEGIVKSKAMEIDTNTQEETGRYKIELVIPSFRTPIILEFVTPAEYASYIESEFEINSTVNLYGIIRNFSKETIKTVEMGFGKPKEVKTYESLREFEARGGDVYPYEEGLEVQKAYSLEQIQALQAKRNEFLANIEEYHKNRQANNNSSGGFSGNKTGGFGGAPTFGGGTPSFAGNAPQQNKTADTASVAQFFKK